jgi:phosphate butyryltransferase
MIKTFDELYDAVGKKPKKRIVGAWAVDDHTVGALALAVQKGFVDATLVGDTEMIKKVCAEEKIDISIFRIVHIPNDVQAVATAVDLINQGEGDVLMKGLCTSDKYMRAILNKEKGLLPPKAVLSHVTVISVATYQKLLIVGDVAVIPAPDLNQKVAITNYLINTAKSLGIEKPKVAILAATEQMLPGMPACVDAAMITKMADRGQISGAYVDGPLAIDLVINKEAVATKKVNSTVAGDADCIVFPNIESGNVFFKTVTNLAGGELAAVVTGAKVPCILTSRGDSTKSKLNSIALAALMAK